LNFLPNINWLDIFPFLAALTGGIIFLVLFYMLYWKPRVELPLPNERFVGHVTMWLPHGLGLLSGPMTTARMTMQRYFLTAIRSEKDENMRKVLIAIRNFVMQHQVFAIKNGNGEKKILLFDANPEDQKFMDVDRERQGLLLHGVQDAHSEGVEGGFEFIGIKLNPELAEFNDVELERYQTAMQHIKYLKDAAMNKERIATLVDQLEAVERELAIERRDTAEIRSKYDRALNALDQKPLTVLEEPKLKPSIRELVKEWFSWPQIGVAAIAYLLAPNILTWAKIQLKEPDRTYAQLGIAVFGFFIIPIGRKIFGRWFK